VKEFIFSLMGSNILYPLMGSYILEYVCLSEFSYMSEKKEHESYAGQSQQPGIHTTTLPNLPLASILPRNRNVVFLHAGPRACTSPSNQAYFDPDLYRILMFE